MIVILNLNGKSLTMRCIESLRPATDAGARCVVVDNGSTDGSVEAIEAAGFRSIEVVSVGRNVGVAAGRNLGLRRRTATDRYALLLDNDTEANLPALKRLVEYMDDNQSCGIVSPCLTSADGSVQASFKPYPGLIEKIKGVFGSSKTCRRPASALNPCYVIGACQMIRCDVIDRIGELDESIFFGPEDADYCIRVRKSGHDVVYLPDVSIIHHWQRSSRKNIFSPLARKHMLGLLHFYIKHRRLF